MSKLQNQISNWLRSYLKYANQESYIIGISGGIDSAVASTLCAMTGAKTIVVSLPIHQNKNHLERAKNHIKWLKDNYENVEEKEIDLTNVFDNFKKLFDNNHDLALANTRSRLRMVALYHIASLNDGLVCGTGNKVEDFGIGFYTKYGDGGVDISPLADLTKTEVRKLANDMKINQEIILAKPSDGLWDDSRSDEDQIGATYEQLEWAMDFKGDENDLNIDDHQIYLIYKRFHEKNKHKMEPIPVFKKVET